MVVFFYIGLDNLSEKRFILLWLVFMQQFGSCCGCHRSYWLLFDHLSEEWFMLRFVILTICQRSGWCCCDWLYFRPFAREVVHAVVVIFDHLPEKWFMLWLFLTICQRNGSCCGGYFWPFARGVVHVLVLVFILLLTICQNYSFIVVDYFWPFARGVVHVVVQSLT